MSSAEFICIFCNETFDNKETLQIHFRQHGDPKFTQTTRTKLPETNDSQSYPDSEKNSEEIETVNCDVCSEVFPTISKAITHKHKVHPDHDAKYFCSWCGKLFTMKHLYDKHIQTNHNTTKDSKQKSFHCDYCDVDFFVPSAMVYHNKFFHRQDTELAAIGQSKKLKLFNQVPLQLYYCPFCGEEYFNKVNLHKHMADDHSDENQSPDDVLRCPLCDAIFYHLDAYELHMTFHSCDDLYSEENEIANKIIEYSLEAVPPIMEKVENDPEESIEGTLSSLGIEEFLQQAMDESIDNENSNSDYAIKKNKKRKKHKKSKNAAITLDEFLNMNKDVFGEGIDFQGIEEIPTQVVAKQLKSKQSQKTKLPPKRAQLTELQKLKKLGIAVKMKSGKKIPKFQGIKVGKKTVKNDLLDDRNIKPSEINMTNSSNDLLSKLLNQNNNQLKIVKKSSNETTDNKLSQTPERKQSSTSRHSEESNKPENDDALLINDIKRATRDHYNENLDNNAENKLLYCQNLPKNKPELKTNINNVADETIQTNNEKTNKLNNQINKTVYDNECEATHNNLENSLEPKKIGSSDLNKNNTNRQNTLNVLKTISHHVTIKSLYSPKNSVIDEKPSDEEDNRNKSESYKTNDLIAENVKNLVDNSGNDHSDSKSSLDALKHLKNFITVKPVSQTNITTVSSSNEINMKNKITTENFSDNENEEYSKEEEFSDEESVVKTNLQKVITPPQKTTQNERSKCSETIKNFRKNVSIKCINQSTAATLKPDDKEQFQQKHEDVRNVKFGEIKDVADRVQPVRTLSVADTIAINKSFPLKDINRTNKDLNFKEKIVMENQSCEDLLKNLTNVTAKPMLKNSKQSIVQSVEACSTVKGSFVQKSSFVRKEAKDEIEIFNIDDSDDEITNEEKYNTSNDEKSIESKSIQALKSLNKHITIKSTNHENLQTKKERLDDDYSNNFVRTKTDNSKVNDTKYAVIHNTSKNTGKICTMRSNTTQKLQQSIQLKKGLPREKVDNVLISPSRLLKKNSQHEDFDSDSSSGSKKIQITEIVDEHKSDEEQSLHKAIVQYPDESNSENEDFKDEDIPFGITNKINTEKEIMQNEQIAVQLNHLKNKAITIRSIKEYKELGKNQITSPHKEFKKPIIGSDSFSYESYSENEDYDENIPSDIISKINTPKKIPHNQQIKRIPKIPAELNHIKNKSLTIRSIKENKELEKNKITSPHEEKFKKPGLDSGLYSYESNSENEDYEENIPSGIISKINTPQTIPQNQQIKRIPVELNHIKNKSITIRSIKENKEHGKSQLLSPHKEKFNKSNLASDLFPYESNSESENFDEEDIQTNVRTKLNIQNKNPQTRETNKIPVELNHLKNKSITVKSINQIASPHEENFKKPSLDSHLFSYESNSENEDFDEDISDNTNKINAPKNITQNLSTNKIPVELNHLKNKSITIKSIKDNKEPENKKIASSHEEIKIPNLGSDLSIKAMKFNKVVQHDSTTKLNKNTGHVINQSNENLSSSDQIDTVNKEVTVKTFQTKTVIQEITTTVTKTIRTVNQTVQQMRNTNQTSSTPIMRAPKTQGIRPNPQIQNYQGVAIRQTNPNTIQKVRNMPPSVRSPSCAPVRCSNQLVPVRPGVNVNIARSNNPRMPIMKKITPSASSSEIHRTMTAKPLRISPNVKMATVKRAPTEDSSGPFSCFKKQKESLIPVSDVPIFNEVNDSAVCFASSSQICKSNFAASTNIVKGNAVVTSRHMKSEVSTSSEQLSRLGHVSGLKVIKTSQTKQATCEEENIEASTTKRTTLEAIEKLQRQGLLVKKPRLDEDNFSDHSNSNDDFET